MIFMCDLETEGHVMVYVTFCFVMLLNRVDHDVTLRFKGTRDGHARDNSLNEFRDLKTSRINTKIIPVGQIQA